MLNQGINSLGTQGTRAKAGHGVGSKAKACWQVVGSNRNGMYGEG